MQNGPMSYYLLSFSRRSSGLQFGVNFLFRNPVCVVLSNDITQQMGGTTARVLSVKSWIFCFFAFYFSALFFLINGLVPNKALPMPDL